MDTNDPSYGTAVGHGYCIGDRVELHSLKGAAEHNGKRGTVTGAQNDRVKVKLDGDKSLALKPVNLTKLDVLTGLDEVKLGVKYKLNGKEVRLGTWP